MTNRQRMGIVLAGALAVSGTCFPGSADSLFVQTNAKKGPLIAQKSGFRVGDLITVLVDETIDSTITANTNTKKESDVQSEAGATDNEFLVAPKPNGLDLLNKEQLPNWDISVKNETKARGSTVRNSELTTSVSCIVTEILDNGLLRIEGDKAVSMNREDCRLHVSGLVRARDVTPANTVNSTQIANAIIDLKGRGPLWNNQRRGLVTRFLDWVSPF